MASNIVSDTIDATYPVAGVDNDTQGFRDNFAIIKQNFAYAYTELTDLQTNGARLDQTNNFNGSNIYNANLQICTAQYHNIGTIVSGQNISFLNGSYQTIRVNLAEEVANVTLNLSDWPETERYAEMTVQLFGNDTAKAIFWTADSGTIKTNSTFPESFIVDSSTDPIIVKFWTYNSGGTVFAEYKGQFV